MGDGVEAHGGLEGQAPLRRAPGGSASCLPRPRPGCRSALPYTRPVSGPLLAVHPQAACVLTAVQEEEEARATDECQAKARCARGTLSSCRCPKASGAAGVLGVGSRSASDQGNCP